MKKIQTPLWVFLLAGAVGLGLIGLSAYTYVRAERADGQLAAVEQEEQKQALFTFCEYITAAKDSLTKLEAASTQPQRVALLKEGDLACYSARQALGRLPHHQAAMTFLDGLQEKTGALFFAQSFGESYGDADKQTVSQAISALRELAMMADQAARENTPAFLEGWQAQAAFAPQQKEPALAGDEVPPETAKELAAKVDSTAELLTELDQPLAVYRFIGTSGTMEVTKRQGRLSRFRKDRADAAPMSLSAESVAACDKAAQAFLKEYGYDNMAAKFWERVGSELVLDYYAEEGGVLYDNDHIRVWVHGASGEVTGLDAQDYLMYHKTRELPAPKVAEQQVKELLKGKELLRLDRCVSRGSGQNEISGYLAQIKGDGGGDYHVFFDGDTGREIWIQRLTTENGNRKREAAA